MDEELRGRYRRDFTNEIIAPAAPRSRAQPTPAAAPNPQRQAQPISEADRHTKPQQRLKPSRRRRLLLGLALLILIAGGAGYWLQSARLKSPVPASVRASVSFPVLYPTQLPSGYHLDNNSFSSSGKVVIYSAVNPQGDKIVFTVQPRPSTPVTTNLYKTVLSSPSIFNASAGKAASGIANGRPLGSLITDKSWLLVSSASKDIQTPDINQILNNIKSAPR